MHMKWKKSRLHFDMSPLSLCLSSRTLSLVYNLLINIGYLQTRWLSGENFLDKRPVIIDGL